jgi:hypothetical protein
MKEWFSISQVGVRVMPSSHSIFFVAPSHLLVARGRIVKGFTKKCEERVIITQKKKKKKKKGKKSTIQAPVGTE